MPVDPELDARIQALLADAEPARPTNGRQPPMSVRPMPMFDQATLPEQLPPPPKPESPQKGEDLTLDQRIQALMEKAEEPDLKMPGPGAVVEPAAGWAARVFRGAKRRASHAAQAGAGGVTVGVAGISEAFGMGAYLAEHTLTITDKDLREYQMWENGRMLKVFADEHFAGDPELRDSIVWDTIPRGLGNMLVFFAGGWAAKGLKAAGVSAVGAGPAVVVVGSGMGASEVYERAKAKGASEEDAELAATWSFFISGPREWFGVPSAAFRVLNKIDRASGGTFRKIVKRIAVQGAIGGTQEAVQESVQQVAQNKIIQEIIDKNQKIFEDVIRAGVAGGSVGWIANTLVAMTGLRMRGGAVSRSKFREIMGVPEGGKVPPAKERARIVEERAVQATKAKAREAADAIASGWAEQEAKYEALVRGDAAQEAGHAETAPREASEAPAPPGVPQAETVEAMEAQGAVSMDKVWGAVKKGAHVANAFRKRFLRSRGDLPEAVFAADIDREGRVGAMLLEMQYNTQDFRKAVRGVKGIGRKLDKGELGAVMAVLRGGKPELIAEPLRDPVAKMRDNIDSLSRHMVDNGLVEGELAITFDENEGIYITRSFQAFDDPKWAGKVDEKTRNLAKAWLREEYPDRTEPEIEGLIEKLLFAGKAADTPIATLARGKLGAKDLSIFKKREAPQVLRALLGEYSDPIVNYTRPVSKMANVIANHEFLTRVRQEGLGEYFFENPVVNEKGEFIAPIAAAEDEFMYPLNGLHTTREIKAAFERQYQSEHLPDWLSNYMKANLVVKYGKTLLSQMTQIRNVLANPGFSLAMGHWRANKKGVFIGALAGGAAGGIPFGPVGAAYGAVMGGFAGGRMGLGMGQALAGVGIFTDEQWRQEYKMLRELRVVGDNAREGELRAALKDAMNRPLNEVVDGFVRKSVVKGVGIAADFYRVGDDWAKVSGFYDEVADYSKARPGWLKDIDDRGYNRVQRLAARHVRNGYPTYSMVPELGKKLRRFPIVGTFISFPAEVLRIGYHLVNLIQTELRDPALRHIGARRLVGTLLAGAGIEAIAKAISYLAGWTKKKIAALRMYQPEWSENSTIIPLGPDPEGEPRYVDISYIDPFSYLKRPVMAMLRGEDWESKLWDATLEASRPFLSEEILIEKLLDVARNQKRDGGQIYNPEIGGLPKYMAMLDHVFKAFEPGTLTSMRRIEAGLSGRQSIYGRKYDPKIEILAATTGHRISVMNRAQGLAFMVGKLRRSCSGSLSHLRQIAGRPGTVTDAELLAAYQRTDEARRAAYDLLHRQYRAALVLGLDGKKAKAVLRNSGMAKRDVTLVKRGEYRLYKPTNSFLGGRVKAGILGREEAKRRRRLIRKFAKASGAPK